MGKTDVEVYADKVKLSWKKVPGSTAYRICQLENPKENFAAYQFEPEQDFHYLLWLKSMDFSIDKNPYHYQLPVRHGTANYIAVFWLHERDHLTDFKTIGIYEDPDNPGEPGKLKIKIGETIQGIDIHADWSLINQ